MALLWCISPFIVTHGIRPWASSGALRWARVCARVFGHCLLSQFFPPRSFVEHDSVALLSSINAKYFVFTPAIVLTDEPV